MSEQIENNQANEEAEIEAELHECEHCDAKVENTFSVGNEQWCESCKSEDAFYCESCESTFDNDDSNTVNSRNGGECLVCSDCLDSHYTNCDRCNENNHNDASNYSMSSGDVWCSSCYESHGFYCESCYSHFSSSEQGRNSDYCESCADNDEENEGYDSRSYKRNDSTSFTLNPFKTHVGIELEFVVDKRNEIEEINEFGVRKSDGSINSDDGQTCEFASDIYNGDDLLNMIDSVSAIIASSNGRVNRSCGFHVHLDFSSRNRDRKPNSFFYLFSYFEPIILGLVSNSRRRNNYCKPINGETYSNVEIRSDRYRTLNLDSLSRHNTIEIRVHQGTINATKIKQWVMLLLQLEHVSKTITDAQLREIRDAMSKLSNRGKLVLLFQTLKLPLSQKKYLVNRIKTLSSEFFPLQSKVSDAMAEEQEESNLNTGVARSPRQRGMITNVAEEMRTVFISTLN